jgi:hypothetical protein
VVSVTGDALFVHCSVFSVTRPLSLVRGFSWFSSGLLASDGVPFGGPSRCVVVLIDGSVFGLTSCGAGFDSVPASVVLTALAVGIPGFNRASCATIPFAGCIGCLDLFADLGVFDLPGGDVFFDAVPAITLLGGAVLLIFAVVVPGLNWLICGKIPFEGSTGFIALFDIFSLTGRDVAQDVVASLVCICGTVFVAFAVGAGLNSLICDVIPFGCPIGVVFFLFDVGVLMGSDFLLGVAPNIEMLDSATLLTFAVDWLASAAMIPLGESIGCVASFADFGASALRDCDGIVIRCTASLSGFGVFAGMFGCIVLPSVDSNLRLADCNILIAVVFMAGALGGIGLLACTVSGYMFGYMSWPSIWVEIPTIGVSVRGALDGIGWIFFAVDTGLFG